MAMYAFESAAKLDAALNGPEVKELIKIYDRDIGAFSTRHAHDLRQRLFEHSKKVLRSRP